ncbi:MAG: tRNA-dihydrouridine synthase [Candidatus Gastranaerophilales bacterium]|nr:tRNA-dihydrouridine synthase [Candidatus Gastranaerophilales bacterium]
MNSNKVEKSKSRKVEESECLKTIHPFTCSPIQPIQIGNLLLKSNVALAPMAGITDYVLRSLIRKYSKTCLLTTEMISSEALIQEFGRKRRLDGRLGLPAQQQDFQENELILRAQNHSPIAYQLSGHKPDLMAKSAQILEKYADMIDINMGCPVNKVVKGQDGCALMRNPKLASEIVKAVKASVKTPVSVKFRLGYSMDELNFVEFGIQMQEAGADLITIHARTRSQMYSGKADWAKIKELKQNVDIPVFANGDVNSIETARECLAISNADGLAIGRGVLGDATLIARIEHYIKTGEMLPPPTLEEKVTILKEHLDEEIKLRGEEMGIKFFRKFYPYYINSIKNAAKFRAELVLENDYDEIINKLNRLIHSDCRV